jgi:hypothetical protein
VAPLGRFITVNHATNMQILIRLLLELSVIGLKEFGRESNREPIPGMAILDPLLRIIPVTAQARHVELEGVCKRIIVEQIVEAATEVAPEKIVALSDLADSPPRNPERVRKFALVPLVQVTESQQISSIR